MIELIRAKHWLVNLQDYGDDIDLFNGGISELHADMRSFGALVAAAYAAGRVYYDPVEQFSWFMHCGCAVDIGGVHMLYPLRKVQRGLITMRRWNGEPLPDNVAIPDEDEAQG